MTTSSNNLPNDDEDDNLPKVTDVPRENEVWEDDVVADTIVNKEYGPEGYESVYYLLVQDTTFDDGWLKSDQSRNLQKAR